MKKLEEQLHKENKNRWMGTYEYSCLTCSHSMSTDENKLICVANRVHETVAESHLCEKWN